MSIKKTIKKCIPKSFLYKRKYWLEKKKSEKLYYEVEKELDKKFMEKFGRKIDWENPQTYNEKLNVSKLYNPTELKSNLTDKIRVVDWVKERVRNECSFIPLLATYDSVDEIDFSSLPKKFVMKMNNDSGSVFICDEKHPITKDIIKKYRYYFQKRNYAFDSYEMQYINIEPKIMIEKYMGGSIRDYKFQCFNGVVAYCQVDFGRFGEHYRNIYNKEWKLLPFNKGAFNNTKEKIKKPVNYGKMWELAEKLSDGFDQVRVDFYDIDGVVYFGEMTFTSASGCSPYSDVKIDEKMGKLWKLDMDLIRRRRDVLLKNNAKIKDDDISLTFSQK